MIKTYLIALVSFFAVDMVWLVLIARNFYKDQLGPLMRTPPNWYAAIVFYLIFIFGLVYFTINPALDAESIKVAVFRGMLFGLITYATYDLTNLATLNDWPLKMTIVDMIWGTVLGGSVAGITTTIILKLKL